MTYAISPSILTFVLSSCSIIDSADDDHCCSCLYRGPMEQAKTTTKNITMRVATFKKNLLAEKCSFHFFLLYLIFNNLINEHECHEVQIT